MRLPLVTVRLDGVELAGSREEGALVRLAAATDLLVEVGARSAIWAEAALPLEFEPPRTCREPLVVPVRVVCSRWGTDGR